MQINCSLTVKQDYSITNPIWANFKSRKYDAMQINIVREKKQYLW